MTYTNNAESESPKPLAFYNTDGRYERHFLPFAVAEQAPAQVDAGAVDVVISNQLRAKQAQGHRGQYREAILEITYDTAKRPPAGALAERAPKGTASLSSGSLITRYQQCARVCTRGGGYLPVSEKQ